MASARFVDPPDELRACSEAFHAEAMKHLDAVFEEQSYSTCIMYSLGLELINSRPPSNPALGVVLILKPRKGFRLVLGRPGHQDLR
jgi:hypothetical protein